MKKLKVYVLDASVLVRQTVAGFVRKMNKTVICGSSSTNSTDGVIQLIRNSGADVIVMGLNEKKSNEADLFLKLRKSFPSLPFIMITPRSPEGAKAALFALKHGAVEYVTKPSKSCNLLLAQRHIEKRLVPALKMIPRLNLQSLLKNRPKTDTVGKIDPIRKHVNGKFELVVISGCTGGVQALYTLIEGLSPDLPIPVIIVQHMPKFYTKEFAAELDKKTRLNVREAAMDSLLLPGQVYLVPGGYHASIRNNGTRKQITLHRGPKEHKSRPSVDVLLRSARYIYGDKILTVYLSGGGRDGLMGARLIVKAGGQIILQNKESSLLWDLPSRIFDEHLADNTYNLEDLAYEITNRINTVKEKTGSLQQTTKRINQSGTNDFDMIGL